MPETTTRQPDELPGERAAMPVLQASGIRKRFGGVVALDGAELTLEAGEVHALLGSNGCGKSTLCKIIAGAVAPDAGRLWLDGRETVFSGPPAAAAAGIGVFYQELSLIPRMTVEENIFLGREPRGRISLVDRRALRAAAEAALAELGGAVAARLDPEARVADLSPDQAQLVEVLKVLAARPRIIILDEATAALDRAQVAVLFARMRALRAQGRSLILISHRMDEVFEVADRVTVMRNGVTVLVRPVAETSRDEVVSAMVGAAGTWAARELRPAGTASSTPRGGDPAAAGAALEVQDLHAGKLAGVSLTLGRGEILGLGGLQGQGQSELLRALFGALPIRGGTVRLGRERLDPRGPRAALRRSIAYVSGDRARLGVMAIRPIFENLVLSLLARDRRLVVARRRLQDAIAPIVERLTLRFRSLASPVSELSGGNQQKVVIGRWLATRPRVLLLDDPTRGIDLQTKADLYRILADLCGQGVSILVYSSDDEELLLVSDRVLVFNGGRLVAELRGDERTRLALYHAAYATGGAGAGG